VFEQFGVVKRVLVETKATAVAWERKASVDTPGTYPEVAVEIGIYTSCGAGIGLTPRHNDRNVSVVVVQRVTCLLKWQSSGPSRLGRASASTTALLVCRSDTSPSWTSTMRCDPTPRMYADQSLTRYFGFFFFFFLVAQASAKIANADFSREDPTTIYTFSVGNKDLVFHRHAGHRAITGITGTVAFQPTKHPFFRSVRLLAKIAGCRVGWGQSQVQRCYAGGGGIEPGSVRREDVHNRDPGR
jgi:hypothetical protein